MICVISVLHSGGRRPLGSFFCFPMYAHMRVDRCGVNGLPALQFSECQVFILCVLFRRTRGMYPDLPVSPRCPPVGRHRRLKGRPHHLRFTLGRRPTRHRSCRHPRCVCTVRSGEGAGFAQLGGHRSAVRLAHQGPHPSGHLRGRFHSGLCTECHSKQTSQSHSNGSMYAHMRVQPEKMKFSQPQDQRGDGDVRAYARTLPSFVLSWPRPTAQATAAEVRHEVPSISSTVSLPSRQSYPAHGTRICAYKENTRLTVVRAYARRTDPLPATCACGGALTTRA